MDEGSAEWRREGSPARIALFGCEIDALTLAETVSEVERLIEGRVPVQHCVVNAAKAVLMQRDLRLRQIVSSCALVNADGQSIVWAGRLLGRRLPERVAGIDLFQALLEKAAERGYGVYFLGARHEVVREVVDRARSANPALRVCGWRDGYWDDDGVDQVIASIRASRPAILFVGMPSPFKEYWLAEHLEELGVPFSMGVGGSFDVYAGRVRRAPAFAQRWGLEWLFRLAQDPVRMWRRYLFGNVDFVLLVMKEWWRGRSLARGPRRSSQGWP
jgi:N-acetylglucosaminyldiphosphoundecaprenol N-acetyl-beta-D-mannosaminyltransferase